MELPRIGVRINREVPAARLVELAQAAERSGVDELWLVEDCFFAGGIAYAATALAVTEKITVGIGILPTVARNPAIAAMELAALANLHPGRLIAGFGHGVASWMRQIGAYPASPLAALDETLGAIRVLLAGETVSMKGKHVTLDDVVLEFPPPIAPPLVTGVRGPKSLAISGASADGTILAEPAAPEYVRAAWAAVDRGRPEAAPHQMITYNWFALDDDADRARERVRPAVASALGPSAEPHLRPLPFGDELLAVLEANSDVAPHLRPEWLDSLAVVGDLAGCVEKIRRLHEAGSGTVVLLPIPGESEEESIAAAGRVAAELRRT